MQGLDGIFLGADAGGGPAELIAGQMGFHRGLAAYSNSRKMGDQGGEIRTGSGIRC